MTRELKLRGMNGVGHEAMAIGIAGPRQLTRLRPAATASSARARGDLRTRRLFA
jgi:hypothetical protein